MFQPLTAAIGLRKPNVTAAMVTPFGLGTAKGSSFKDVEIK